MGCVFPMVISPGNPISAWDSIETTTIGMTHPLYKGAHECKKGIFYYLDKIVFYMHHYQHCSFYYFHCGLSLVFLSERMIRQLTVNHIPKGENIIQWIITIVINSVILIIKNSKIWYFWIWIFSDIPMNDGSILSIHNFFIWKSHVGITTITIWFIWFKVTNATLTTILRSQKLTQIPT